MNFFNTLFKNPSERICDLEKEKIKLIQQLESNKNIIAKQNDIIKRNKQKISIIYLYL